jgi:SRSO17 transposase
VSVNPDSVPCSLVDVIGHADRAEPLNDYCLGLMLPVDRKSVEPLAAVTAPARVSSKHQSLLHFVGQAPWSDEALLARVRDSHGERPVKNFLMVVPARVVVARR